MRLQSSLGDVSAKQRFDHNAGCYLMVGKVERVWKRKHTADVIIINEQGAPIGKIFGSEATEGAFTCRILERYAGYDSNLQKSFGDVTPIQKGCTVLVGFINNLKEQPVILGCLHSTNPNQNNLTDFHPIYDERLAYECIKMNRLQDYFYQDGKGQIEIALHTKSFVTSSCTHELDDARDSFDYKDLRVKDKTTKDTVSYSDGANRPLDWLAVFRDSFNDAVSGWLQFLLSATKGVFRITKDTRENKLTFIELGSNGDFRVRQQLDSYVHDEGQSYTEFKVRSDGIINIEQSVDGEKSTLLITPNGITLKNSGKLSIKAKEVELTADAITLDVEGGN